MEEKDHQALRQVLPFEYYRLGDDFAGYLEKSVMSLDEILSLESGTARDILDEVFSSYSAFMQALDENDLDEARSYAAPSARFSDCDHPAEDNRHSLLSVVYEKRESGKHEVRISTLSDMTYTFRPVDEQWKLVSASRD